MGIGDKLKNKAQQLMGEAKERVGGATGNERMQAEGATEKTEANAKQAGEHVKDAGRDTRDAFRG